ncbi:MAG: caspase family protein [bacterium]
MGRALGELGYDVKEYVDGAATRDALKTLVERGLTDLVGDGRYQRLLVYFAGHGATVDEGEGARATSCRTTPDTARLGRFSPCAGCGRPSRVWPASIAC